MPKRSIDELGEELCNYCALPSDSIGTRCYGEPIFCVDSGECEKAYEAYEEAFENGEIEE